MRVAWFTESPRDWRSPVAGSSCCWFVLLAHFCTSCCWIDATGKSRATAERNRSDRRVSRPRALQRIGSALLPERFNLSYGVRRRSHASGEAC